MVLLAFGGQNMLWFQRNYHICKGLNLGSTLSLPQGKTQQTTAEFTAEPLRWSLPPAAVFCFDSNQLHFFNENTLSSFRSV